MLPKPSLLYHLFAKVYYVDTYESTADNIFRKHRVPILKTKSWGNGNKTYNLIKALVPFTGYKKIQSIMKDLNTTILISGHSEYNEACQSAFSEILNIEINELAKIQE